MLRRSLLALALTLSLVASGCASRVFTPKVVPPDPAPMPLPQPMSVLIDARAVSPQPLPSELQDEKGGTKKGFVLKQEGYTYTLWVSMGDPTIAATIQHVENFKGKFRAVVRPVIAKNEHHEPVGAVRFDYAGSLTDFRVQTELGDELPRLD